jgi:hypothetical protein
MNRRDFLKIAGLASTSLFLYSSPLKNILKFPVETVALGKIFRGTSDGEIHVSEDGGKTWKLHTRFGSECPILGLNTDRHGQVNLQAGYKYYSFRLALSKNGKDWLVGPTSTSSL